MRWPALVFASLLLLTACQGQFSTYLPAQGPTVRAGRHLYFMDAGNFLRALLTGESPAQVQTVAGYPGGADPNTTVLIPVQPTVDANGNIYFVHGGCMVKVLAAHTGRLLGVAVTQGQLATVAGTGACIFDGNGQAAIEASLGYPDRMAVDPSGNLFIVDQNTVRMVAAADGTIFGIPVQEGKIYQLIGGPDNTPGYAGDGGPPSGVAIDSVTNIATDANGNLFFCDAFNSRIRVVSAINGNLFGVTVQPGYVYTVAGDGTNGSVVNGMQARGGGIGIPFLLALGPDGSLYFDSPFGINVLAASTTTLGQATTVNHIYELGLYNGGSCGAVGGLQTQYCLSVNGINSLAVDSAGNLFFAQHSSAYVMMFANVTGTRFGQSITVGHVYQVAGTTSSTVLGIGEPTQYYNGDDIGANTAQFVDSGNTTDAAGNLIFADAANGRLRFVANAGGTYWGQARTAGNIYTLAGAGGQISPDGTAASVSQFRFSSGVAADSHGNIFFGDDSLRVMVVAKETGTVLGVPVQAGKTYKVMGTGNVGAFYLGANVGNGGPALAANPDQISALAVDAADNLYAGSGYGVQVIAARTGTLAGNPVQAGYLYAYAGGGGSAFTDGMVATALNNYRPTSMTFGVQGDLIVGTWSSVQVVAAASGTRYGRALTAGRIYALAAASPTFTNGYSGDGGPGVNATLDFSPAVATDAKGNVFIAEGDNCRLRVVPIQSGELHGQTVQAGYIYTLVGNGDDTSTGDGGPAVSATLAEPISLAFDPDGNLFVSERGGRIRMIAWGAKNDFVTDAVPGYIYTIAGEGSGSFTSDGIASALRLAAPTGLLWVP